jgi:Zn-dependent protease with chaperone function
MGFENNNATFGLKAAGVFSSVTRWVNGLLGHHDFSPEETLAEAKNIDPRLVPKVPMQSADIDANLMLELSKMGMKRGRLVSAQSHPELMQAWQVMSARAGLKKAPQLIIVESKIINAMTVSPEEVVVTTALLKKLDLRETCAVLGHELGHATSDHKRPRIAAMAVFGILGALVAHKAWQ